MIRITEEVRNAGSIAVSGHIRPDGDCVGSVMGLYLYLKKELPEAEVDVYLEKPAEIFDCISHIEDIKSEFNNVDTGKIYDVFIVLDCADDRLGEVRVLYEKARKKINIDHHISNESFADENHIFPKVGSTSELVFDLIGEEKMTKEIAECIYVGIVHDTGLFQFDSTTAKTMNIAGKLMETGISFTKIVDETFFTKTYGQNRIMGKVLMDSRLYLGGKLIVGTATQKDMEQFGVQPKHLDGIVNQLRVTKGVEAALFLYENERGGYKASLRSNGKLDVARLAMKFGGGGHVMAAGADIEGTAEEIIEKICMEAERQLVQENLHKA